MVFISRLFALKSTQQWADEKRQRTNGISGLNNGKAATKNIKTDRRNMCETDECFERYFRDTAQTVMA